MNELSTNLIENLKSFVKTFFFIYNHLLSVQFIANWKKQESISVTLKNIDCSSAFLTTGREERRYA